MKTLSVLSAIAVASITPLLTSCDSGEPESAEEKISVSGRGLDSATLTAAPAATPGFPYTLNPGEVVTFTPMGAPAFPLGTFEVETSRSLRQDPATGIAAANVYGNATPDSFRYLYTIPTTSPAAEVASTQATALINPSIFHGFGDALFIERFQDLLDSSQGPGSITNAFDGAANGTITGGDFNIEIAKAASSLSMLCTDNHPTFGLVVRFSRSITVTGITSTNADLSGAAPFITGTYTVTDNYYIPAPSPNLADGHTIDVVRNPDGSPVVRTDNNGGTFRIDLNGLDLSF